MIETVAAAALLATGLLGIYVYVLYPRFVCWRARGVESEVWPPIDAWPSVVVVVSAHNEAESIGDKMTNVLTQDYPSDRLRVVVSSDGSTDSTNAIVQEWVTRNPRVELIAYGSNRGKTAALSDTLAALPIGDEIVVLSDANSTYEPTAVRLMVEALADERVGVAAGTVTYRGAGGEAVYRSVENRLRECLGRIGAPVTAEGSIYAVRRSLLPARLEEGLVDDFLIPLMVYCGGHRVTIVPRARSTETYSLSLWEQFHRRARIANRALRTLIWVLRRRRLPNVVRGAFHLTSHRVLRWLLPVVGAGAWLLALVAVGFGAGLAIRFAVVLPVLMFGLGAMAYASNRRPQVLALLFVFLVMNAGVGLGVLRAMMGRATVRWTPVRG